MLFSLFPSSVSWRSGFIHKNSNSCINYISLLVLLDELNATGRLAQDPHLGLIRDESSLRRTGDFPYDPSQTCALLPVKLCHIAI